MTDTLNSIIAAAISTLDLVAALFFLRFWIRTRDMFFLLFAMAFGVDGVTRLVLAVGRWPDEHEPYFYLPRLLMFGLIIAAVISKNRLRP